MTDDMIKKISSTSKTSLITLHAHSIESKSENPILSDPEAMRITAEMKTALMNMNDRLLRKLANEKLQKQLVYHIAIRARKYDEYAEKFIEDHPDATIVNLGCGLDTRYHRLKTKPKHFIDLDLPEVIAIKSTILKEDAIYKMIPQSIFDNEWLLELKKNHGPILFIAEGLFMYLDPNKLNSWLKHLADSFPESHLLFETVVKKYTRGFYQKITEFKLRRELGITGDISYHFGLDHSRELEGLSHNFKFLEDWSYFDETHPKVGWMNIMGKFDYFRYVQWTVYYKIKAPLL